MESIDAKTTVFPEDMYRAYIQRSGETPLHISADVRKSCPFSNLLAPELHRWSSLDLVCAGTIQNFAIDAIESSPALLLKSILISCARSESQTVLPIRFVLQHLPALRQVDLHRIVIDWASLRIPSTVTHLSLHSCNTSSPFLPTVEDLVPALIPLAPVLQSLVLARSLPMSKATEEWNSSRSTPLTSLHTLDLQYVEYTSARHFFRLFPTPNLRVLKLMVFQRTTDVPYEELPPFPRSFPNIIHLHLAVSGLRSKGVLRRLSEAFDNITTLTMKEFCEYEDDVLRNAGRPLAPTSTPLFPSRRPSNHSASLQKSEIKS